MKSKYVPMAKRCQATDDHGKECPNKATHGTVDYYGDPGIKQPRWVKVRLCAECAGGK